MERLNRHIKSYEGSGFTRAQIIEEFEMNEAINGGARFRTPPRTPEWLGRGVEARVDGGRISRATYAQYRETTRNVWGSREAVRNGAVEAQDDVQEPLAIDEAHRINQELGQAQLREVRDRLYAERIRIHNTGTLNTIEDGLDDEF